MSLAYFTLFGIPKPVEEYKFHPTRKWRFDFAWPGKLVAVEIEGGIWIKGFSGHGGSHSLPSNIVRDMEKFNAAMLLGWRIFRFQPSELTFKKLDAGNMIKAALGV